MLWVFDMDNTVYGPTHLIEQTVVQRMKIVLSKLVTIEEGSYASLKETLKKKHGTDETILAFALEFHLPYEDLIRQTYLASSFSIFALGLRKGASIIPTLPGEKCILTNSPRIFAHEMLSFLDVAHWFQSLYANGPETPIKKPDAPAYRSIKHTGQVVMIDDSEKNLIVPKQLGWTTVWFPEQPQSSPAPEHIDHTIEDLASLCDLVDRQ